MNHSAPVPLTRALLIGTFPSGGDRGDCEDSLQELGRLCDTFGLEVVEKVACPIKKIASATYLGKGKLEELKARSVDLIVFDDEVSPRQGLKLEEIFGRPVIDRTELIIDVFAQRAQTKEARLQVEMARVQYQLPRLKGMWTHLSRQRTGGGGGYLRGAGEKQIEIDRRTFRRRIVELERELEQVGAQRQTQRSARLRSGIPTFSIVGYTNAGKSTLLRSLAKAEVLVEDKLFATLDPTTKKFTLPNRQEVLLVDTVGFIRKIPHTLVAAFKSTLEEVVHTDILLHLIDVSHPMAQMQAEATLEVLAQLHALDRPILTVLNKIDQCHNPSVLMQLRVKYPKTVQISALHGTGLDELSERMMQEISLLRKTLDLRIPQSHYALVSELLREGRVVSTEYEGNDILIRVEIPARLENRVLPFLVRI